MDEDDVLQQIAGSLEDDVLRQLHQELAKNTPRLAPNEYEYLVIADTQAKIYVSREGVMTRREIAAQLRRLADYVESLTGEQAHRP